MDCASKSGKSCSTIHPKVALKLLKNLKVATQIQKSCLLLRVISERCMCNLTLFVAINIIFKLNVTNNRKYFLMTFLMSKHHNVCYRHHSADYTLQKLIKFTAFILSYHDKIQQCKEVVNFKVYNLNICEYLYYFHFPRQTFQLLIVMPRTAANTKMAGGKLYCWSE